MHPYRPLAQSQLRNFANLIYLYQQAWQQGPHTWTPRFSVQDPDRLGRDPIAAAQAAAERQGVPYADIRFIRVHPDDVAETPPAGASTPWDGGRLELVQWGQVDPITGTALGTAVMRR